MKLLANSGNMELNQHIDNVINRKSKDEDFAGAIIRFVEILNNLKIDYAVIGSYALQTFLQHIQRLPNDFDITLSENNIDKIKEYCISTKDLVFHEDFVASKVEYLNGYCMHLIPEKMRWVDRSTNKVFERYTVYHPDRVEKRKIRFVNFATPIDVPVHELTYSFCLAITQRLDSNIYADNVAILARYSLEVDKFSEFKSRIPVLRPLLQHRFMEFRNSLVEFNPELLNSFDVINNALN